ncbi:uncharacterized protein [Palaemon carinicauda]|uniref:uncharacterized protein n=1 Tax=Palaemon carinicauda TaxID=392227 RepID=UPI0035B5E512
MILPIILAALAVSSSRQDIYEELAEPWPGGWSAWTPFSCSATCGGGVAVQRRYCNEPLPSMFGRKCMGLSNRKTRCNTHSCGELSYHLAKSIIKSLRDGFYRTQHVTEMGKPLILHYDDPNGLPKYHRKWMKYVTSQEKFLTFDSNITKMSFLDNILKIFMPSKRESYASGISVLENSSLSLSGESTDQAGIWMCVAAPYGDVHSYIVSATSVLLKPNWLGVGIIHVFVGKVVALSCNAQPLHVLFSTANNKFTMQWYHNGELHQVMTTDYLFLYNVSLSHSGVWSCVVKEELSQTTAYYEVVVHSNWMSRIIYSLKMSLIKSFHTPSTILITLLVLVGLRIIVYQVCYKLFC